MTEEETPDKHYTKVSSIDNLYLVDLNDFKDTKVLVTEKLDGTNARVGYDNGKLWCGGHNHILEIGEAHKYDGFGWGHYVKDTGLDTRLAEYAKAHALPDIALYGEFCGPKIQANPYKLEALNFYCFDIRSENRWLPWGEVVKICSALQVDLVPVELENEVLDTEWLEKIFRSPSTLNPSLQQREGVVVKAFDETERFQTGKRKIFKYRTKEEIKKKKRPKKVPSEAEKMFSHIKSLIDSYLNEERVAKALSHLREENAEVSFRSVIGALEKDIVKEALPEDKALFEEHSKEYQKALSKLFGSNAAFREMVNSFEG